MFTVEKLENTESMDSFFFYKSLILHLVITAINVLVTFLPIIFLLSVLPVPSLVYHIRSYFIYLMYLKVYKPLIKLESQCIISFDDFSISHFIIKTNCFPCKHFSLL